MKPPPPRCSLVPYTTLFRSRGLDRGEEITRAGRLGQELHRACLHRADGHRDVAASGDEDDRNLQTRSDELPLEVQADRKSTRLNSSHMSISNAVFCLKKKYK